MKRLAIIFMITVLSLTVIPHSVSAIQYGIDFLEPGNPGGWTMSSKTWDNEWAMAVTEEVYVDVWLKDVPEPIITGGLWIVYDPDKVSLMSVDGYDKNDLPGPWSSDSTKIPDPLEPGTYFLLLGWVSPPGVIPNDGDIILARLKLNSVAVEDALITVMPIPDFDTYVGWPSGTSYDPLIAPATFTIHQTIEPCCTQISPAPLKLFAGKTFQFSAGKSGTCSPSDYVWSDTCVHAAVDPATGLFTAETDAAEECSVCVTDTANPTSCTDAGCNPPADCCANFIITTDGDDDGVANGDDNCPNHPNGPTLGTCVYGTALGQLCTDNGDCGVSGFCSLSQEDNFPPGGNGVGDACECEGDFNADGDVDGTDASQFKSDFGRSSLSNPCPMVSPSTTTTAAP